MKYFAIDLKNLSDYHGSGKSVNETPMKHFERTLRDYELFFVTRGELYLECEYETALRKNEVWLHAKGAKQRGTKYSQNAFFWLHFDGKAQVFDDEESAKAFCKEETKVYFAERFELQNPQRILFMWTELNHYLYEENAIVVRNALLSALLSELARQYSQTGTYKTDKRFAELLAYLSLNYTKPFLLSELASKFSYNVKYLPRLFRKYTGRTAKEYVTAKRIAFAKNLLMSGSETVKTIAYQAGFSDEYYFMRAFKKSTGMTPKEYRTAFSGCQYT